jgi:hypothetical protein
MLWLIFKALGVHPKGRSVVLRFYMCYLPQYLIIIIIINPKLGVFSFILLVYLGVPYAFNDIFCYLSKKYLIIIMIFSSSFNPAFGHTNSRVGI